MNFVNQTDPPSPTDDELLSRYSNGDRAALEELFHRYRNAAYRVAHRLLGNDADALDAVQEGYIKALTHLNGFQGRSSFKTWLMRVVSNSALDLGRMRGRRESMQIDTLPKHLHERLTFTDDSGVGLDRAETQQLLEQALTILSPAQRQTFVLFAEAELSYREVAEATGASIGTVMSRLFYARQKLRAYLSERAAT